MHTGVNLRRHFPPRYLNRYFLCRRPAAVNGKDPSINKRSLVGAQVQRKITNLIRLAETSNGLALVEFGANLVLFVTVVLFQITRNEGRIDSTRCDAVHADFCGVIHGELARHGHDGTFGPAIGETALHADQTRDRTEVDDRPVGGSNERQTEFRHQIDATDVDAEDPVEVICASLFGIANQADARVVDKDIELFDVCHAFAHGVFVGNVEDLVGSAGEFGGERFGSGFVNIDDNYFCACLGEDPRSLFADAACAARDQGRFTVNSERCSHRVNCSNDSSVRSSSRDLAVLNQKIVACRRCPRLIQHCTEVARVKRRAWLDWEYWGKPVPSFGDPEARLLIVGLAPGAHGANRTGRMFTGDKSGDFLYRALHRSDFASQPESRSADDGLVLNDAWITAAGHCAPPDNKPTPDELGNCSRWLQQELKLLKNLKVVVTLGAIAHRSYLEVRGEKFSACPFGHNLLHDGLRPPVISSYHPSQQNTSTGRLTQEMLDAVFARAAAIINK